MKITACYIVKNEEKNIARSIESLSGDYDELIVVDTGSTDNTVAIAKALGAVCYSYEWHDDFSAARNYTISKASGDWLIFFDADEYFVGNISIRQYLLKLSYDKPEVDALYICEINAFQQDIPPSFVVRIFRKDENIYYQGVVHETLKKKNGPLNVLQTDALKVIHTGYEHHIMPHKLQRNLDIMLKDIASNGEKAEYYYYIAECYFGQRKYQKAIEYVTKAIEAPIRHIGEEANYYHILIESMRQCQYPLIEMEKVTWKAIELFPDMPEFYAEQGMIFSSASKLEEALQLLNKSVELYDSPARMKQSFGYIDGRIIEIVKERIEKIKSIINKNKVVVVIPIYKAELSELEKISLLQMNKVLGNYERRFIAPESLTFDFGECSEGVGIERFPDYYFSSIAAYSKLMLEPNFYRRFIDYEYMFIHQTDVFVFADKLLYFCELGYDYIGAPVDRFDPFWLSVGARVGNGGASLRKVDSAIRMLEQHEELRHNHPLANLFAMWEDAFWGYCGQADDVDFTVPDIKIAINFAVQGRVGHAYQKIQKGWRPFACHGWNQQRFPFWKPVIESYGYDFGEYGVPGRILYRYERIKSYLLTRGNVNMRILWGLCKQKKWNKYYECLNKYIRIYCIEIDVWKYALEELIYLIRRIEMEHLEKKRKNSIQIAMFIALRNAIKAGVAYPIYWNLLFKLIPLLQKYDYEEAHNLINDISIGYWKLWQEDEKEESKKKIKREKFIVVKTCVVDEVDYLQDFIEHTLSFADAIIVDASVATLKAVKILKNIQKKEAALILCEEKLSDTEIHKYADICMELKPTDFLMKNNKMDDIRVLLEKLEYGKKYRVDVKYVAPYIPFMNQEKFILDRPLVSCYNKMDKKLIIDDIYSINSRIVDVFSLYIVRLGNIDLTDLQKGIVPAELVVETL